MPDTKKIKNTKIAFIMLSIMAVAAVLSFTMVDTSLRG